jgi:hypothetical protein
MAVLKESDTNLPHDNITLSRSAVLRSPSFSEADNHSTISKTTPCNKENEEDLQDSFKQTTARVLWDVDTYEPQNNADRQPSIYSQPSDGYERDVKVKSDVLTEYSKETSDASEDVTNPNIAETVRQDVPDQAAVCVPNGDQDPMGHWQKAIEILSFLYPDASIVHEPNSKERRQEERIQELEQKLRRRDQRIEELEQLLAYPRGSGGHHGRRSSGGYHGSYSPRCDHNGGNDQYCSKRYRDDVNDHRSHSRSPKRSRRRS